MADVDVTSPITACENAIDHFSKIIAEQRAEAAKAARKADGHNRQASEAVARQRQWVAAKHALVAFQEDSDDR